MILALDTPSSPDFAVFFTFLTTLLVAAYYIKQIFFSQKLEGHELVTEKRLQESRGVLADKLLTLEKENKDLYSYAHEKVHFLNNLIQNQANTIALLEQKVRDGVSLSMTRVETKLDHHDRLLVSLSQKMSRLIGYLTNKIDLEENTPEDP